MTSGEPTASKENQQDMVAFVIMPFGDEFDEIYKDLIMPALESAGYSVQRADSRLDQQNILKDIVKGIDAADLIVAELTSLAPNVLYELGIAHGLLKPTVLLAQEIDEVPFDLRSYRILVYSTHYKRVQGLKEQLADIGARHRDGSINFGNPVGDFAPSIVEGRLAIEPHGGHEPTAEPRETTMPEEAEAGLLDFIDDGLDASRKLGARIEKIGELTHVYTQRMAVRTAELQSIAQEGRPGGAARVRKVANQTASDLTEYANELEVDLPGLRGAWEDLTQNLTSFLSVAKIERDEDRSEALKLKEELTRTRDALGKFLSAVRAAQEAATQMKGLSRDLNRAVTTTITALDGLINELTIGESYTLRMLNLLSDRLD